MFNYFDGRFRQRPQQNLSGASRQLPKEELIKKAAEERRQREELRRKIQATITIQSFIRGFVIRRHLYQQLRKQFDETIEEVSRSQLKKADVNVIGLAIRNLIVFYSKNKDQERLMWLCHQLIKSVDEIVDVLKADYNLWIHRIKLVLHFNQINLVNIIDTNQSIPIAIPLRVLEIFTDVLTYRNVEPSLNSKHLVVSLWNFLVANRFFHQMKVLLERKVPEPFESSAKPSTPLASTALEIILRPLSLDEYSSEKRLTLIRNFLTELLCSPLIPQIRLFIIPAIVKKTPVNLKAEHLFSSLLSKEHTSSINSILTLKPSIWLLHSYTKLIIGQITGLSLSEMAKHLKILSSLSPTLLDNFKSKTNPEDEDEENDEKEAMEIDYSNTEQIRSPDINEIFNEILSMLNEPHHVQAICLLVDSEIVNDNNSEVLVSLSCVCHSMLQCNPLSVNQFRLLYTLAFKASFLRLLWKYITIVSTPSVFGSPTSLLYILSRGLPLAAVDWQRILPQLTLFGSLFSYLLPTIDDVEFYQHPETVFVNGKLASSMPFSLIELTSMSLTLRDVCVGLVELAYHDARPAVNESYQNAMKSVRVNQEETDESNYKNEIVHWLKLFKSCVKLLRQIRARDSRVPFCSHNHWISKQVSIPIERPTNFREGIRQRRIYRPFVGLRHLSREELEAHGPPLSTSEVRNVTILQEIPFVVSFHDRVKILQTFIARDKSQQRGEMHNFLVPGTSIQIVIRRNFIYEDAFEKLSPENEPNLKQALRVQLINTVGLDEAGIDGGGIFREFLSELLKTAFDPNRGFFISTHDRLLYPNPAINLLVENYLKHYFFIGRMLGKAIYENMLIELPFAGFFLAKLLARHSTSDIDMHNLASLDPVIYKNLVSLKSYQGDVSELGLDFTIVNSDFGTNEVVELKPGGANIPVTAQNRIEYIHLMADYRLNKQIRSQCAAFKQGLADILDLDWLRMFDTRELQILISGSLTPIDIDDLRKHTHYGGYTDDHPVIEFFWKVLKSFTEPEKRKFLKFVTSCSRPPLLGFKDLFPAFCIQNAGNEPNRLPTASTCMNLLKLPEFQDEETMRKKLQYALESGSGFELS